MHRYNTVKIFTLLIFVTLLTDVQSRNRIDESEEETDREGKLLSLFQIVRFPNDPCFGNGNRNGTCYTAAECTTRGGTNGGACASGYGVCCTFSVTCGQSSNENCTYFESTRLTTGQCRVQICPCNTNICQLRLDFNQFVISGPSTSTISVIKTVNGVGTTSATGKSVTTASQCLTDTFAVSNPGGNAPPTICGTNTGEHMYVDAARGCNDLSFQLGQVGVNTGLAQRQWSIKVTQYTCDYINLAPAGCTQYFFNTLATDVVQTFNFQGGQHLANQNQAICVRRERGNCRICWTTALDTDFMVSGPTANMKGITMQSMCCGYGPDGMGTMGYDCVTIPGALKATATTKMGAPRICGRSKGLVTVTNGMSKTVCSNRQPFNIRFLSDQWEFLVENMAVNKQDAGFRLTYLQNAMNCL